MYRYEIRYLKASARNISTLPCSWWRQQFARIVRRGSRLNKGPAHAHTRACAHPQAHTRSPHAGKVASAIGSAGKAMTGRQAQGSAAPCLVFPATSCGGHQRPARWAFATRPLGGGRARGTPPRKGGAGVPAGWDSPIRAPQTCSWKMRLSAVLGSMVSFFRGLTANTPQGAATRRVEKRWAEGVGLGSDRTTGCLSPSAGLHKERADAGPTRPKGSSSQPLPASHADR